MLIFQDRRPQFQSHRELVDLINYTDYGLGLASLGHSLDSSEPSYPSPGSLSGLDRLAALGTMGPAGSITSSVYINPFHPAPSLASPRRRLNMSARSRSHELSDWTGGSGDLRDYKQRKPRTSQVSSTVAEPGAHPLSICVLLFSCGASLVAGVDQCL